MSESVIDAASFTALKEMTGVDFIDELIDTFLAEAPRMLADLRQALAEGNAELFRRSAHSLKSNSLTFGALNLGEMARELEALGRENQLGAAADKLEAASAEYVRVKEALKELKNG